MKKVLLCILDGFGYRDEDFGNATSKSMVWDLFKTNQSILLEASGKYVGLPAGQFGNSEVGHLTIGSGRVLKQKLPLIDDAIASGSINNNETLNNFITNIKNNTCHIMGLFSSGGVHSNIEHFFWAIKFLRNKKISIKAHIFLDGRDVGYQDGLKELSNALANDNLRISEISTIQGRFWAMDRDKKWDRTQKAYDAIVDAKANIETDDPIALIKSLYEKGESDETIQPIVMKGYSGAKNEDSFWMLNFRTDRIKQILTLLLKNNFKLLNMVSCDEEIDKKSCIIFKPQILKNTLGEVLSKNKISQLRIAETEKYAHVTYFFNGGEDVQYALEDRVLIPSPKVQDYSETPDMSSAEIKNGILKALDSSKYNIIISNFASPDMIGHTGNFEAVCKAIQFLDNHIETIINKALKNDFHVILTADHGNAENMINKDGTPLKTHTCALVPFIILQKHSDFQITKKTGSLADIAPTILKILGIEKPSDMTGNSLIA